MTKYQKKYMEEALIYFRNLCENTPAEEVNRLNEQNPKDREIIKNVYVNKAFELHDVLGYSLIEAAQYMISNIRDTFEVSKIHGILIRGEDPIGFCKN